MARGGLYLPWPLPLEVMCVFQADQYGEVNMRIFRLNGRLLVITLALLAVASAAGLALSERFSASWPATQRLHAAADRRPVNKIDQLIWDYQARIRRAPDDVNAYAMLGAAYVQRARETGDPTYYGRAEAAFDEALKRDPQNVEALIGKGTLALSRHQFREALALGEQARSLNPTIPRIYGLIGDAQVELGQYEAALESFQTMVDMRPDLSSYSRASYMRELYGDVQGAIEAMQWAVQAGGPNLENANWTRVQLGHLYFNSGRLDEAEAVYRRALTVYPGYVPAIAGLARVHAARGEYDQAIQLYTDVVNRMPLAEYVIALGDVYEAAGRSAEAQQQFDLVRAIERLYLANGVDTDLEMALFQVDHNQGQNLDETLARARRAFEKRPTIHAADVLAWALYQDGQYAQAYELSQQALQLGTKDALLFFHAGMIAYRLGHRAEAQAYLEQALALNPNFSLRYRDMARSTLTALRQSATTSGP